MSGIHSLSLALVAALVILFAPAGNVSAASPASDPLPGPGDFSLSVPPGWTRDHPPALESEWRLLAAFSRPTDAQHYATLGVVARGGDESLLTESSMRDFNFQTHEYGTGCTFDGVGGAQCAHGVFGSEQLGIRVDTFRIVKNGIVWSLYAFAETGAFDRSRAEYEAILLSFHTDFVPSGAPAPQPAQASCSQPVPPRVSPSLAPAWAALCTAPPLGNGQPSLGEWAARWLNQSGVTVNVEPIGAGAFGLYAPATNTIRISPEAAGDIPQAAAAVFMHELRHAAQRAENSGGGCVEREVDATSWEAITWGWLTGGSVAPSTRLQAQENYTLAVLTSEGEPGLYKIVVDEPGYQAECALWTPG